MQRLEALERVRAALGRLRELGPVSEILRRAPAELSESSGLDRVLLSQVKESRLLPVHAHFRDDPEGAENAVEALRETPLALEYPVVETELMRRRRATIVRHPGGDPRVRRPPIPVAQGLSYVAAPVVLDGGAIGFFHGAYVDRQVESLERDAAWAFADGFAQVFERAVLRRRVREQRRQLRELVAWTDAMAAELSEGAIELEVEGEPPGAAVRPAALPNVDVGLVAPRRAAHPARAGRAATDGARGQQQGDRDGAGRVRGHGEVPREEHPAQARRGEPGGGGVTLPAAVGADGRSLPKGREYLSAREASRAAGGVRLCRGR